MAYSVRFTKRAEGEFATIYRSVSPAVRRNLDGALSRLEDAPFPRQNPGAGQDVVRQLQGEERLWRIRIGNYRMAYRIEGEDVTVVRVAHRSEVYRGM
ncbi:MAG: type II toxin-antitoxin system RelE/ParE family toxin [Chloroflexi bacterium]|nr:type II toxin-antitoxin system RelE/ParE family toxin [Chloroflexota bacterium]